MFLTCNKQTVARLSKWRYNIKEIPRKGCRHMKKTARTQRHIPQPVPQRQVVGRFHIAEFNTSEISFGGHGA